MSTSEIIVIVFAALAALGAVGALFVCLFARRRSGAFDDRALREEQKRAKEDIVQEIDFARRSIGDSNTQSTTASNRAISTRAPIGSPEKSHVGIPKSDTMFIPG